MTSAADPKPGNTKTVILDAAAACFSKNGSEATSIDDIARYLGATKGKIYHHFRSKGELLYAVRLRSVTLTMDNVKPHFQTGATPQHGLGEMARAHVKAIIENLTYHQVVVEGIRASGGKSTTEFEREMLAKIRASQRQYRDMYCEVVNAGIVQGVFRQQQVSVAVQCTLMLLNSPVYWYSRPAENVEQNCLDIASQIAGMALGALGFQSDSAV